MKQNANYFEVIEKQYTNLKLSTKHPIIIRIKCKSFKSYMEYIDPFDVHFQTTLFITMRKMMKSFGDNARIGYTFGDELILLLAPTEKDNLDGWYGGSYHKLLSVSSSMVTAIFNELRDDSLLPELGMFTSTCFNLHPSEVLEYFKFIQGVCCDWALKQTALEFFDSNEIKNLTQKQLKNKLLKEMNINFDLEMNPHDKFGSIITKTTDNKIDEEYQWDDLHFDLQPTLITDQLKFCSHDQPVDFINISKAQSSFEVMP